MEKHPIKRWEISIIELQYPFGKKYKVTRRMPELLVAETKIFDTKEEARRLFEDWLK